MIPGLHETEASRPVCPSGRPARSEAKLEYMQRTAPERALPAAAHIERVLYDNAAHEQEYLKDSSLLTRVHRATSEIARGLHVRCAASSLL